MDKTALKMAIIFGVFFQHLAFDTDDFDATIIIPDGDKSKNPTQAKIAQRGQTQGFQTPD
jgi:hypothetical protein